jgi:hypothetical protein
LREAGEEGVFFSVLRGLVKIATGGGRVIAVTEILQVAGTLH